MIRCASRTYTSAPSMPFIVSRSTTTWMAYPSISTPTWKILPKARCCSVGCRTPSAASAWVDRDGIGFRPQGLNPLPVMPLAILSDPFGPPESADQQSWEWNIEARLGTHQWLCDPETKKPRKIRKDELDDRIPEITI